MAIKSFNDLLAALEASQHLTFWVGGVQSQVSGAWGSHWNSSGFPGHPPTAIAPSGTGAVPTDADSKFLINDAPAGKELRLAQICCSSAAANQVNALFDRLWHAGGYGLNSTAVQTVNSIPIAARPDTNGVDTELWLEVTTNGGATPTTVTATYTNSDGVTGRTATATLPATVRATSTYPFTLQGEDRGVRSVQSIQLSAATGAAGVANLIIARRIVMLGGAASGAFQVWRGPRQGMPKVYNDSCLYFQSTSTATVTSSGIQGSMDLVAA